MKMKAKGIRGTACARRANIGSNMIQRARWLGKGHGTGKGEGGPGVAQPTTLDPPHCGTLFECVYHANPCTTMERCNTKAKNGVNNLKIGGYIKQNGTHYPWLLWGEEYTGVCVLEINEKPNRAPVYSSPACVRRVHKPQRLHLKF